MHITYDLPVAIEDILEAKKRLAGKIYKNGDAAQIILVNDAKAKYSLSLKICSAPVHLKFAARLINSAH